MFLGSTNHVAPCKILQEFPFYDIAQFILFMANQIYKSASHKPFFALWKLLKKIGQNTFCDVDLLSSTTKINLSENEKYWQITYMYIYVLSSHDIHVWNMNGRFFDWYYFNFIMKIIRISNNCLNYTECLLWVEWDSWEYGFFESTQTK